MDHKSVGKPSRRVPAPKAAEIADQTDDEAEHILTCIVCGQSFGVRDANEFEHHEQEMHGPRRRN